MLVSRLIADEWYKCQFWREMKGSVNYDETVYTESDVDNFVEIQFRQVAEALGIKYRLIKDVLYGKNIDFFETKARIFADVDEITEDGEEYNNLVPKLLIPNTTWVNTRSGVERFFTYFEELSVKDKIEIVSRLSKAIIKLPMNDLEQAAPNFDDLGQSEKCEVLKSFFDVEVIVE